MAKSAPTALVPVLPDRAHRSVRAEEADASASNPAKQDQDQG